MPGQLEVHQHQIRGILLGDAQTFLPGLRLDDVVAGEAEYVANQLEVQRIVLDDEDAARRHKGTNLLQRIDQLLAANWLAQVRIRAEGQAAGPIVDVGGDDHRDSGGRRIRLELGQNLPAVEPRQPDVEHHGGRQLLARHLESLDAVHGPQHPRR